MRKVGSGKIPGSSIAGSSDTGTDVGAAWFDHSHQFVTEDVTPTFYNITAASSIRIFSLGNLIKCRGSAIWNGAGYDGVTPINLFQVPPQFLPPVVMLPFYLTTTVVGAPTDNIYLDVDGIMKLIGSTTFLSGTSFSFNTTQWVIDNV